MKRFWVWCLLAVIGLTMAAFTSQAGAWEFSMNGDFVWQLDMRGQWSSNGFFGQYDSAEAAGVALPGLGAATAPGVFAPYNFWFGAGTPGLYAGREIASGSDVTWNTQYMQTDLAIRINPAVLIRGRYYIGEWAPFTPAAPIAASAGGTGELVASALLNNRYGGIQRSFSPGYWNMLWLTAQLPWGEIAVGRRSSTFGTGLNFPGSETRSSESFALAVPWGPLRIVFAFYPSRRGFAADGVDYFNVDLDKNATRRWEYGPTITYRQGPLDAGFTFTTINHHRGGEGVIGDTVTIRRIATPAAGQAYTDRDDYYGAAYVKYYNGRIFFNAEVGFDSITDRNTKLDLGGAPVPVSIGGYGLYPHPAAYNRVHRNSYIEHWRAMAEISCLTGPAKTSVLYGWSLGDDRRAGALIDRRGTLQSAGFANTVVYRPYSYLLVYAYGTGLFINPDTNNGYAEDISLWAARFDYAVAANLNLYVTAVKAERQSKSGTAWGCITPTATVATGAVTRLFDRLNAPNIPDTDLGYEFDAGFSWKLLEGLTVNTTFAWWQPGDWFKWACRDKRVPPGVGGVPGWGAEPAVGAISPAVNIPAQWGINPNRTIDPVWGMEMLLTGSF